MNIAHISHSATITGGSELALLELIDYELTKGVKPFVVLPGHGKIESTLDKKGVAHTIIGCQPWRHHPKQNETQAKLKYSIKRALNSLSEMRLKRYLLENNIDLVHINTTATNLGSYAAKQAGIPLIWHLREFNGANLERDFYSYEHARYCFANATKLIAVSETLADGYDPSLISKDKLVVIYDTMKAPSAKRATPIFANRKATICLLGTICIQKGQLDSVEALHLLDEDTLAQIKLNIIGKQDDPYFGRIEQAIRQYGLARSVEFRGFTNNPYGCYQEADIALTCSRSESFGRTTVEAMMSGCLVIGRDCTCTHELLAKGNGLLYSGPKDLAEKIKWAISNKAEASKIARTGKNFADKSFKDGQEKILNLFIETVSDFEKETPPRNK